MAELRVRQLNLWLILYDSVGDFYVVPVQGAWL